jgi:hypothetical protein
VDRVHRRRLTGLRTSLNAGRWLLDRLPRLILANRYLGYSSPIRRLRRLAPAGGSAGSRVFSSYDGRFSMRFAPMRSQRWGERVYANLNRRRAATKCGKGEVARSMLVDSEGGLRWSFGSKDMRQGFLELPSTFSTDQLLRSTVENSNLVST